MSQDESDRGGEMLRAVDSDRAIIETLLDGFAIADLDEVIVEVNSALCDRLGYAREEMIGRNFLEFVEPADAERVREETAGRRMGRRSLYQVGMLTRSGARLEMLIAATPLEDASGQVTGSVGVFHDVTERTRLETMLGESRRRLSMQNRTLTHLSRSPEVHSGDLGRVAARVTEAMATTLSCSAVSLFRVERATMQVHCEDRFEVDHAGHARRAPIPGREIQPLLDALGHERVLAASRVGDDDRASLLYQGPHALPQATSALAVPIVTRQRLAGFLLCEEASEERSWTADEHFFATSIADLLARAQENAERRAAEEQTRAIALFPEQNPHPVLRISKEGVILFANAASAPLLRCWATTRGGRLPDRVSEHVRRAFERGESETIEVRVDRRVISLVVVPILTEGYVNLYGNELTELYRSMDELVTAREEALEASRVKSRFLASMSHEIRTPMNAVIGLSELLAATELSTEQAQYAELIRSSGLALLELINDILDLSKIESGRIELDNARIALPNVIEDSVAPLALRAHEKGVELICRSDYDAPLSFRGDPARLRQVLVNICGNAIKFTSAGEVVVESRVIKIEDEHRFVCSVRDTGPGIPAEELDSIFEAFQQGPAALQTEMPGTGLGLAISSRLVRAMGGEIRVDSTVCEGSTFTIDLPVDEIESADDSASRRPLDGARLLVLDPHDRSRETLQRRLTQLGARVDAHAEPDEGLAGAEPDAILVCPPVNRDLAEDYCRRARAMIRPLASPRIRLVPHGFDCHLPPARHPVVQLVRPVPSARLVEELRRSQRDAEECVERESAGPEATPGPRTLSVLVAEDNAVNRLLAVRLLERRGHKATAVHDGREALEAFRDAPERFDLVLMDIQMPEMDGIEATRAIREIEAERGGHIAIIALTAHVMHGDRERCLEAGMDAFLAKPVRASELDERIAQWAPAPDPAECT